MEPIYLLTGAAGHLGSTVAQQLLQAGARIRALVLPSEMAHAARVLGSGIELVPGDVCDIESLRPLFAGLGEAPCIVIHMAGIVSIKSGPNPRMYDVNVNGTKHIVELCEQVGVKKLVHVSSVHALPELGGHACMQETDEFDAGRVVGNYAKTKAEATNIVLQAAARGLNACVVHPSGIIGPNDFGRGHVTQMVIDYLNGALTAGVRGGYDFVDVRDVAAGIIACAEKGRAGQCYILSNRYISVPELLGTLSEVSGRRPVRAVLPLWFAKLTAPCAELYYALLKRPPLFTRYSMYTLNSNSNFSHEKADRELGYRTRELKQTLEDTVRWLTEHGRVRKKCAMQNA